MPSFADQLFDDAGAPLIREVFGVTVSLRTGPWTTEGLTAIVDVVDYEVTDVSGVTMLVTMRDYTLRVADTKINGVAVKPDRGFYILETINGQQYIFEVLPLANRPAVEPAAGESWLVHTKQVFTPCPTQS